jgi:hypothetical protein
MAKATQSTQSQKPKAYQSGLTKILALKKEVDEKSARRSGGDNKYLPWFKAKPGDNIRVRILPLPFLDVPFITVAEHGKLHPNQPYRSECCPKSVGEGECPICDYAFTQYKDAKDRDDQNAMSFLKGLMPKQRAYAILYNRATNRLEKYGMSLQMLGQILSEIESADVDPTDVHNGRDGRIKVILGQNNLPNFSFSLSELSTPLLEDEDEIEKVMTTVEDHKDEILRIRTSRNHAELKALLNFEEKEDDDSDEGPDITPSDEDADAEATRLIAEATGKK